MSFITCFNSEIGFHQEMNGIRLPEPRKFQEPRASLSDQDQQPMAVYWPKSTCRRVPRSTDVPNACSSLQSGFDSGCDTARTRQCTRMDRTDGHQCQYPGIDW